jgi:hypothetical protein
MLIFFLSQTTIYISIGLHKDVKLQEKLSALKREHPALQIMKFLNFFLIWWVIFYPPGSGSTDLIESGSECYNQKLSIKIFSFLSYAFACFQCSGPFNAGILFRARSFFERRPVLVPTTT